jgi:hypothetical protein
VVAGGLVSPMDTVVAASRAAFASLGLAWANLFRAKVIGKQLAQAEILIDATMPDGTNHL